MSYIEKVDGISVGDAGYGIYYPYDGMLVGPYTREMAEGLIEENLTLEPVRAKGAVLVHFDIKEVK